MLSSSKLVGDGALAFNRLMVRLPLGVVVVAALALSACGRAGAPEMPPGPIGAQPAPAALSAPPPSAVPASSADAAAAAGTPQDTIAKTGFDVHGNPAASPGQKKPFILDPLLQ